MSQDFAEDFIKSAIPDYLLELNPVIAGGFALNLYLTQIILSNLDGGILNIKDFAHNTRKLFFTHSDVDLFFLTEDYDKNSGALKMLTMKDFSHSELNTNFIKGKKIRLTAKCSKEGPLAHLSINEFNTNLTESKDLKYYEISDLEVNCPDKGKILTQKNSRYATTYAYITSPELKGLPHRYVSANANEKIQIIHKTYDSVQSLIDSFDIALCSIAWYDGKFYFGENFLNAINSEDLILNNVKKLKKSSFGTKLFQHKRYIKYAERYGKSFSEEATEYYFMLILDSLEVNQIKDNESLIEKHLFSEPDKTEPSSSGVYLSPLVRNGVKQIKIHLQSTIEGYEESIFNIDSDFIRNIIDSCIGTLPYLTKSK
jgi:hypothetical protein